MEIEYRPARGEDAAAVLDYCRAIGAQTRNLTFGAAGLPLGEEEERAFLQRQAQSEDDATLLAFDGAQLVGMAGVSRIARSARLRHRASVSVSVRKSHWRKGIATALMRLCIERARRMGCTVLQLEVLCENTAAVRPYEKLGFAAAGRFARFFRYEDGTFADAFLMTLDLTEQEGDAHEV